MLTLSAPLWLAALPLPLLIHFLAPPFSEARTAVRSPWFHRVAIFSGQEPAKGSAVVRRGPIRILFAVLAWGLLVVALARPQRLLPAVHRTVPTRDLLLAVDLSGSMEAEDFTDASGERVDRLTAVKGVLAEFLARREGDRVGLVVFGNAAFVQVPFTQDIEVTLTLLDETVPRMAGAKTAFGDAIGLAITLFEDSDVERRVLIALTDGNDTGSRVPPVEAARIAADRGVTIYTVAVGDPAATGEEALDEEALRSVAEIAGGDYFHAADRDELAGIYDELDALESREIETVSHRPRVDLFPWPLALAFLIGLALHLFGAARGEATP